jgi:hypothetical protein
MFNLGMRGLLLLLFVPLTFGCHRSRPEQSDPKKVLTDYISFGFGARNVQDRQRMLELLGGDAKARLASWSDEQFKAAFLDTKKQFVKLRILETQEISPQESALTYELIYMEQAPGQTQEVKLTHKKLAQLRREGDRWAIFEVRNLKQLIEYRNEMSLP